MKKAIYLCLFLAISMPTGAFADIKMDMMNDKIDRLEQDLNALQRKMYQSGTSISAVSSNSNSNLDDLYNRITEQGNIVRDLTAQIEKLEYEQQQLNERLNKMNADIDVRFNMLPKEGAASVSSGNSNKKSTANTQAKITSAKEAYDKAYNLLKKGNYTAAEEALTAFMRDYPKSDLVGNANYWLGETYYARGKYEQAVGIFADGFTKYKKNSKAADNLLKLGLTMNKLKKKSEACTAFKSLPLEFPKASKALKDRAKAEAKKLSCK